MLLVVVGGGLWAVAAGGLDQGAFLAEHWVYVQQSTGVSEAAARTLLDRHWTILRIANCLLVFVLGVSLVAACVLRRALGTPKSPPPPPSAPPSSTTTTSSRDERRAGARSPLPSDRE